MVRRMPTAYAAAPEPADPTATDAPLPEEGDDSSTSWSGDLYEEGDETDPEAAFATLSGVDGVVAWLDRAEDSVLTGWVREPDGTVYRYTDADAWAIDVDAAQLVRDDGVDEPDEDGEDGEDGELVDETPAGDESGIVSGLDFLEGMTS